MPKTFKFCRRNGDAGALERGLQFVLIQVTVLITINPLEELPERVFCSFDEQSEFAELYATVAAGIDDMEDIAEKVVGVFQGCIYS